MEAVIEILIRRNGMSWEDAKRECDLFRENALYMIEQGYPVWQVEDEFVSYFGIEPDYLINFIM